MLQKCQPQKVVKVECHGLRATLVSRFIYDWQHFGKEVKAMIDAVSQSKCLPEKPDYNLAYRTITEVHWPPLVRHPFQATTHFKRATRTGCRG